MSSLRQEEPAYEEMSDVVGVQPASASTPARAHAIPADMAKLGRHGLARCSFPAEHLTLVPDLTWTQVRLDHRCEHCAAELDGQP